MIASRTLLLLGSFSLLLCSCSNSVDAEARARAEAAEKLAAETKSELEAMKAEAAQAKEAAAAKVREAAAKEKAATEAKAKLAKDLIEASTRWNAVADGMTFPIPMFGNVNFHWSVGSFPHPTFKGGSAEAYGAFAGVLLAFLQRGDNFDFLIKNQLVGAELRFAERNNPTFEKLLEQFSQPNAHGNHDEQTRKALKGYLDRIRDSKQPRA